MKVFTLDVTLLTAVPVKADTLDEARRKLSEVLDGAEANFGMLDDAPLIATVAMEGNAELSEINDMDDVGPA